MSAPPHPIAARTFKEPVEKERAERKAGTPDGTRQRLKRAFGELEPKTLPHRRLLHLKFTPPLHWGAMLAYFSPRAIPGVEAVTRDAYARTMSINGSAGLLRATQEFDDRLTIELASDVALASTQVKPQLVRMFDLEMVPAEIAKHFARDKLIGPLVAARPGLRVPGAWDAFEFSVRVMLGQQVSVAGATTLARRLVSIHGRKLFDEPALPTLTHAFPSPTTLADADIAPIGLPRARARAISEFASRVASDATLLDRTGDLAMVIARLVALRGIGPWTANYIAMRALGQRDAFPESDLGLLRAATKTGHDRMSPADLLKTAERWRPLRAYAAMQLWLSEYPRV
jgi:3-methyladenine DNA glycosylase/8-oxoguanine DNA glycosylase